MDKPFDPTKPVQTRDGRKARILATDCKFFGGQTIMVLMTDPSNQKEYEGRRFSDGRHYEPGWGDSRNDLVNVPEQIFMDKYVILLPSGRTSTYDALENIPQVYRENYHSTHLTYVFEDGVVVSVMSHGPIKE